MSNKPASSFDEFEHYFSDEELHSMRQLLESGAVQKATQLGLNSWSYLIKLDGELFECEVKYNVKSIKSGHCACGIKGTKKICKHMLLAAYWHILKVFRRKQIEPATKFHASALNELPQADLVFLLQSLIRTNQKNKRWLDFLLRLEKLDSLDFQAIYKHSEDYYHQYCKEHQNLLQQEKQLITISQELYFAGMKSYGATNIIKACYFVLAAIQMVHLHSLQHNQINRSKMIQLVLRFEETLKMILADILAPQSLNKISKQVFEFIHTHHYQAFHPKTNLYLLLHEKNKSKDIERKLVSIIKNKCLETPSTLESLTIWNIFYQISPVDFKQFPNSTEFKRTKPYGALLSFLGSTTEVLDEKTFWTLMSTLYVKLNDPMKKLAFEYARNRLPSMSCLEELQILLQMYYDFNESDILKLYFLCPCDPSTQKKTVEASFTSFGWTEQTQPSQFMDLYIATYDWNALHRILNNTDELETLMKYDVHLPDAYRKLLIVRYADYLSKFKNTNAGPKAKEYLKLIGKHLLKYYPGQLKSLTEPEAMGI